MTTLLGSQTSILEEFLSQSDEVAFDTTIDTLVIRFDQRKYEEFLRTNPLSLSLTNTREPST